VEHADVPGLATLGLTTRASPGSFAQSPLRIAFVTSGLGVGGAETSLITLARALHERGFATLVLSLRDDGPMGAELRRHGVTVVGCAMHRNPFRGWRTAVFELRRFAPQLVQGWMYHGNLFASLLCRRVTPTPPAVWGVRHHPLRMRDESISTRAAIRVARVIKPHPALVIFNSEAGRRSHAALGFSRHPSLVIPNGIDTTRFRPSETARREWRMRWGFGDREFVIGWVARFHPAKDPVTFLRVCRLLAERHEYVRIVMAGTGIDARNATLATLLGANVLNGRVRLLGPVDAVESLYPALDLLLLTSRTEALPNVLLEAMSSGVPCVATDVGDCAQMIADTRCIAPVGDVAKIADAVSRFVSMSPSERAAYGDAVRHRVHEGYGAERSVGRYVDAYRSVASPRATTKPEASITSSVRST
jgi:glycosyltransferase involved in cell wall biosynthesis